MLGPNGAGKTHAAPRARRPRAAGARVASSSTGSVLEDTASGVFVPPEAAADRRRVPGLSAVPAPERARQRRLRTALARSRARRGARRRRSNGWRASASPSSPQRARGSCPAARRSASRWCARSPSSRVLLLLDEPLAALDVRTRAATRRDAARSGSTSSAASSCWSRTTRSRRWRSPSGWSSSSRVAIVQSGTPAEVTARPRSAWVADLVGVNLLRGTGGRRSRRRSTAARSLIVPGCGHAATCSRSFIPRAVALHRSAPGGHAAQRLARRTIDELDHDGARVRVRISGALPIVAEVTPAAVAALGLDQGGDGLGQRQGDGDRRLRSVVAALVAAPHWRSVSGSTGLRAGGGRKAASVRGDAAAVALAARCAATGRDAGSYPRTGTSPAATVARCVLLEPSTIFHGAIRRRHHRQRHRRCLARVLPDGARRSRCAAARARRPTGISLHRAQRGGARRVGSDTGAAGAEDPGRRLSASSAARLQRESAAGAARHSRHLPGAGVERRARGGAAAHRARYGGARAFGGRGDRPRPGARAGVRRWRRAGCPKTGTSTCTSCCGAICATPCSAARSAVAPPRCAPSAAPAAACAAWSPMPASSARVGSSMPVEHGRV